MSPVIAAAAVVILGLGNVAIADDDPDDPPVTSGTSESGFWGAVTTEPDEGDGGSAFPPASVGSAESEQPEVLIGQGACAAAQSISSSAPEPALDISVCDPEPADTPTVTPADARRAFEELKLPGSTPTIEPPDGLTLVNFATNFFTSDTAPLSRTVVLLGQQVTIEATPATWTWTFGDGTHLTTADPGAPYPNLRTTHDYTRVGTYDVTLATTYTGRFRVAQGPWQTIPGTVTITSAAQQLRTIEATPQLVGH